MSYTVRAEWDETGWWVVTVPAVPGAITQCRRLDQVPADAAEIIEIQTGKPVDPAEIDIQWWVPGEAGSAAERAATLRQEAEALVAQAAEEGRRAVHRLRQAGFSYRDIGGMTGMSYQRAQQIGSRRSRH
ncbi:MAG: type II toxin-antitoxin system HicB family antitoxin [Pseudonocardiaceae bacterium]